MSKQPRTLRGWFIFTATQTFFCKMKDHQIPPPRIEDETARIEWSGKRWPKPIVMTWERGIKA